MIVTESPIVFTLDADLMYPSYAWALVEKLLADPKLLAHFYELNLHVTEFLWEAIDRKVERQLSKLHRCTGTMIRKLYHGVCTNNIGYANPLGICVGHGIYPLLSRANHSCAPNAQYASGNPGSKEVGLIALQDIHPGEPVTWNYSATDDFLNADWETRVRTFVRHFWFVCRCDKCQTEMPERFAKMSDRALLSHFTFM